MFKRIKRYNYFIIILQRLFFYLPDKIYLKLLYRLKQNKCLNLKDPKTFTEKIQWLKLYNRKDEYTKLVDKAAVKEIVGNIIGKDYIIPTLGVYDTIDEIPWEKLPSKFVLKTTHGGGGSGVVICSNKEELNIKETKKKLKKSLSTDIYRNLKEWPYKHVPKRIIAETYISNEIDNDLRDYKFFCFNGEPKFLKVDFGRFLKHHANYYDLDWNLLPFGELDLPPVPSHHENKPKNFDKMVEIARKLSKNIPFLRVDLYNINEKIYFGEVTFFPASGLSKWTEEIFDLRIGELINI